MWNYLTKNADKENVYAVQDFKLARGKAAEVALGWTDFMPHRTPPQGEWGDTNRSGALLPWLVPSGSSGMPGPAMLLLAIPGSPWGAFPSAQRTRAHAYHMPSALCLPWFSAVFIATL